MENVDRFFGHFKTQLELMNSIGNIEDYKTHKKILYVSFIDALSGFVYPQDKNRNRFVKIISNFSNWGHAERLNVPALHHFLQLNPGPDFAAIRRRVNTIIDGWDHTRFITLDHDTETSSLKDFWPRSKNRNKKKRLEDFEHGYVFYNLRNFLIHEFREQRPDMTLPDEDNPYYTSVMKFDPSSNQNNWTWNINYPTNFLKQRCEYILKNLESYFKGNNLDPIKNIRSGKYGVSSV